jgi:hypothetical protein
MRPPSWRDPRLAIGVLIVLGSMVLGARVVAAADDTVPFYVASHPLTAGDDIDEGDVHIVQIRLDGADQLYLSAAQPVPQGLVARGTLAEGELVSLSAVGTRAEVGVAPVAVPVDTLLSSAVRKGALVDIWVAEADPQHAGGFLTPHRLISAATVAQVQQGGGALGTAEEATVVVLLADDQIAGVLAAMANKADITVLAAGAT